MQALIDEMREYGFPPEQPGEYAVIVSRPYGAWGTSDYRSNLVWRIVPTLAQAEELAQQGVEGYSASDSAYRVEGIIGPPDGDPARVVVICEQCHATMEVRPGDGLLALSFDWYDLVSTSRSWARMLSAAGYAGPRGVYGRPDVLSTLLDSGRDYLVAFGTCTDCVIECARCEATVTRGDAAMPEAGEYASETICSDCVMWCGDCGSTSMSVDDYSGDCCSCRSFRSLHDYNYRPDWRLHGHDARGLYLGMEYEIGGDQGILIEAMESVDPGEEFLFAKEDGSVDGIEIVTHPASPDYLRESSDLVKLARELGMVGGYATDQIGVHIHVSRAAFGSAYHAWKFLYFHYANPAFVQRVAQRGNVSWASFGANRESQSNGYSDLTLDGAALRNIAKQRFVNANRYTAVNCQNEDTIELRYFRSTTDGDDLIAYVDFVEALYDFTRTARVKRSGRPALTGLAFRRWLAGQPQYARLVSWMVERDIPMDSRIAPVRDPYTAAAVTVAQ